MWWETEVLLDLIIVLLVSVILNLFVLLALNLRRCCSRRRTR